MSTDTAPGIRTETAAGPAWLPRNCGSRSRESYRDGNWELVIERRQIIGRIGWQRVTETFPAPVPAALNGVNR